MWKSFWDWISRLFSTETPKPEAPKQEEKPTTAAVLELRLGSKGADVGFLQARLNKLGFGQLVEDDIFGQATQAAVKSFQRARGLQVDGVVGPATRAELNKENPKPGEPTGDPKHLQIALGEVGVKEVPGSGNNPKVIEYHSATTLKAKADAIAWCASFASWVLEMAGIRSTRSAWARDYLNWGVRLSAPRRGCIVVHERNAPGGDSHVNFFLRDLGDSIECVGGNQSNAVTIARFPKSSILGYRWPASVVVEQPKPTEPVSGDVFTKGWKQVYTDYILTHSSPQLLSCSIKSLWGSEPTGQEKKVALVAIFRAMAYAESSYNPTTRLKEVGLGTDMLTKEQNTSEGLFQVSYQDALPGMYACDFDWAADKKLSRTAPNKTIFNGLKNLDCAMKIVTKLLKNSPGASFETAGKKYWAVLRRERSGAFSNFNKELQRLK